MRGTANDGDTYVDTAFQGGWDVTSGQAGAEEGARAAQEIQGDYASGIFP